MDIAIQEVAAFPAAARTLRVDDGRVELGNTANFQWTLLDYYGNVVSGPGRNTLSAEQYEAWGEDDTEVAHAVAANLGLTPL
jgi:hypothetical protein